MAAQFDPYHKWLGIAPDEQPPDHYRLLGIKRFEYDPEVIESAVDQRMAHVRGFQTGTRSALSQRILNELSAARGCLLNSATKAAYDQILQARLDAAKPIAPVPPPSSSLVRPLAVARPLSVAPTAADNSLGFDPLAGASAPRRRPKKRAANPPLTILVGAAVALLAIVGLAWMFHAGPGGGSAPNTARLSNRTDEQPRTIDDRSRNHDEKAHAGDSSGPEQHLSEPREEFQLENPDSPATSASTQDSGPNDDQLHDDVGEAGGPSNSGSDSDSSNASAASERELPPDADELKAKVAELEKLFKDDYAAAKKPPQKLALAEKLLGIAGESEDAVERFALLQETLRLAVDGLNPVLALQAIDALAEHFTVDRLGLAARTLEELGPKDLPKSAREQLLQVAMPLIDEAVEANQFKVARRLAAVALGAARKSNDTGALKALSRLAKQLAAQEKLADAAEAARQQLIDQPNDAEAHLTVGKYLCLVAGDWLEGLPHLRQGSDTALAKAAKDEAQDVHSPSDRVKVGNEWWNLAESAKGSEQARLRGRAVYWYEQAVPELSGLSKAKVEMRLREAAENAASSGDGQASLADKNLEHAGVNQRSQPVLPKGALLYLSFAKETIGVAGDSLIIRDLSGRNNDASTAGTATMVRGRVGPGLQLNGGELRITPTLNRLSHFTLGAWVYLSNPGEEFVLFEQGTPSGPSAEVTIEADQSVRLNTWNFNGPPANWIAAKTKPAFVPPGKWAYLTVRLVNGSAARGKTSIAVNGQAVELLSQAVDAQNPTYARFGGKGAAQLDEIVLFDRCLSDAELQGVYQAGAQNRTLTIASDDKVAASRTTPKGRRIDLLGLIDPAMQKRETSWHQTPAGLRVDKAQVPIEIPVTVRGDYVLHVEFTRTFGNDAIYVMFPTPPNQAALLLSGWGGQASGLDAVEGRAARDNPTAVRPGQIENNRRYKLDITVRGAQHEVAVDVTLDGGKYLQWQGATSALGMTTPWLPKQQTFGLAANEPVVFHAATLKMLSGVATIHGAPSVKAPKQ